MKINTGLTSQWFEPSSAGGARFQLKPLDNLTMTDVISDGKVTDRGIFTLSAAGRRTLLRNGLVGWDGITDEKDEPFVFDMSKIDKIPYAVLLEIATELVNISTISVEERKN